MDTDANGGRPAPIGEYTSTYLDNYKLLVEELPELAEMWPEMDEFERHHYHMLFMQTWGTRKAMGMLYKAGRLTPDQGKALAALDRQLIEHLPDANRCYRLTLQGVAQLFLWGTPLVTDEEPLRLTIPPRTLQIVVEGLAPAVVPELTPA